MNKHLPKWVRAWHAWLGFVVVLGAASAVIVPAIPDSLRLTWFTEHQALAAVHETDIKAVTAAHEADTITLAGRIKSNMITILENGVYALQRERRALTAAQRQAKTVGEKNNIQREIEQIDDQLNEATARLKAKRGF